MPTMIEKMIVCMVASLLVLSAFPSVAVGSGVDVDVGVDLSAPYFRFASLDAAALAEITHPEPTTPEAMQKVLHPTTISSYEKIDLPGKKYTDDEARSLWAQHLAQYPGRKKYSQAENEKRFEIFRKNLEKVSEQNFLHGGGFSYKAAFADLSSNEFAKMKGLVFKTEDIIHDQKADEKKRATKARDKAYADWVSFRNTFGVDAKNPYKTPYNETAKGKAKLARYRQVKQALANLAAKKKAATIAEQKRLTALAVKQSAMRDMKKAKQAKVKADAEAKKAAKKLADAKKKEEIAKKQASKKLANQKAKAAKEAKLAAQKKKKAEKAAADKAVKDKKVSESRAKASAAKAEKQRAVAEKKAQQAAAKAKKALEKARAAEEKAKKAAEKAAAKAQSAAAATPTVSKVLMELEADAEAELDAELGLDSDSLDAEQLASDALIADQLDAEVNALSDLDASTEVDSLHGLDGALDASAESAELAFLELDAELMEFLGVDAQEQQSIFARFETREPVEVDVVTPIGETPVKSPPREGTIPLAEKNAQRASNAGAHNLEFPGEVSVEIPGVPVATPPAKPTPDTAVITPITTGATSSSTPAATVAAAVADAASAIAAAVATVAAPSTTVNASPATTLPTVGMQPAANPTPTVQPTAQPTVQPTVQPTSTASSTSSGSAILSPAIAGAYKPTAAVRRMATDKSVIDIDWRTKAGVLSPVKSQGQCGSCWAQSAITVVESLISIRKNHTVVPLSVQQVVSCDNQDSGCDGGNPITALAYLSNWAVSSETHYPYDQNAFANGGSAPVCNETLAKSGFPYVQDSTTYENDEIVMAQALQRGPLSALVDASKWQFYDGSKIVYPASGCGNTVSSLDHSVVIVGLGTLSNGERYWIVRNHWDSSWGAGGYIFLAYGQNTCGIALQVTEATLSEKAFSQ